jgi:3-dehydroquinate dehydratase II
MNILFLQGPNLNLLGIKSSRLEERLTLDKLNKEMKKNSKKFNVKLKTLQTHKEFQALNFLQRNRNWANGVILIPTSWAYNNFTILETLKLIKLKTVSVYFDNEYSIGATISESILKSSNIKSLTGNPIQVCSKALELISS